LGLLNLYRGLLDIVNLAGDDLSLSLSSFFELVLNLLHGDLWFFTLKKALLDRWISIEILVKFHLEADWLWCCLLVLVHFSLGLVLSSKDKAFSVEF